MSGLFEDVVCFEDHHLNLRRFHNKKLAFVSTLAHFLIENIPYQISKIKMLKSKTQKYMPSCILICIEYSGMLYKKLVMMVPKEGN